MVAQIQLNDRKLRVGKLPAYIRRGLFSSSERAARHQHVSAPCRQSARGVKAQAAICPGHQRHAAGLVGYVVRRSN